MFAGAAFTHCIALILAFFTFFSSACPPVLFSTALILAFFSSTDGHKSQYILFFDVILMLAETMTSVDVHYFLLLVEQIEELASLVRDNLYSKQLVLSTEEFLVTLLQHQYHDNDDDKHDRDTTSTHRGTVGNTIELQPTSSYNHLLLHRP